MAKERGSKDEEYAVLINAMFPDNGAFAVPQLDRVQSLELKALADVFKRDLFKLGALALLPVLSAGSAGFRTSAILKARHKLGVDLSTDCSDDPRYSSALKSIVDEVAVDPVFLNQQSLMNWQALLDSAPAGHGLPAGRDALYAALVLWSYTIFESVSIDLWIEAVNARPMTLGRNVLESLKASIALKDLAEYGFDVRDKLGSVLKKHSHLSFESVHAIEQAYKAAFRNPHSGKRESVGLEETLRPFRDAIKRLECVRNLIAHRGGRIDPQFSKNLADRGLTAREEDYRVDSEYRMHPNEVAEFVLAARGLAESLLRFVDNWLVAYPDQVTPRTSSKAAADSE